MRRICFCRHQITETSVISSTKTTLYNDYLISRINIYIAQWPVNTHVTLSVRFQHERERLHELFLTLDNYCIVVLLQYTSQPYAYVRVNLEHKHVIYYAG